jgi:hypothetical protein
MLPLEEIIIPCIIFGLIIIQYIYAIMSGAYGVLGSSQRTSIVFFRMMRAGWVEQNHLLGQAAVNTTRDYIRVMVFLAGNAIICASILAGFALNNFSPNGNNERQMMMLIKLGCCVGVLLIIFILLLLCLRYILHFR